MSGYFQARAQQRTLQRMRLTITFVLFMLLAVGSGLVYLAAMPPQSAAMVPNSSAVAALDPARTTAQLLVSNRRIETTTRIDRSMFDVMEYDADRVPPGSLTEADFNSVAGFYVKEVIHAHYPLHRDDLTEQVPFHLLPIPPGHRAISIDADARELVEGFVVPSSRVDVLWRYVGTNGKSRVKTLVPFVKVLSVGSNSKASERSSVAGGRTTATLLVTVTDAQRIELARAKGHLSLALVGGVDGNDAVVDGGVDEGSLWDPDELDEEHVSMFEITSERTGERIRYCQRGKRFKREACG